MQLNSIFLLELLEALRIIRVLFEKLAATMIKDELWSAAKS